MSFTLSSNCFKPFFEPMESLSIKSFLAQMLVWLFLCQDFRHLLFRNDQRSSTACSCRRPLKTKELKCECKEKCREILTSSLEGSKTFHLDSICVTTTAKQIKQRNIKTIGKKQYLTHAIKEQTWVARWMDCHDIHVQCGVCHHCL